MDDPNTLQRRRRTPAAGGPPVSVVVPALDEAEEIETFLRCLRGAGSASADFEVVVVDGGSSDDTRDKAAAFPGVRVVGSRRGRAAQMNAGAAAASGEVLWFLHCDARPLPGSVDAVRDAMEAPWTAGGFFRFTLRSRRPVYRVVEAIVRMRCHWLVEPYGDQGIFVRRRHFQAVGGFPEIPILEDIRFVRRLRRRGGFRSLPIPLPTSARKWEEGGVLRTSVRYWLIAALDRPAVSPRLLARLGAKRRPAASPSRRRG